MRFLPHMNRKRWLMVFLLGLAFVASPFIAPSLITLILWFVGFPLMTTGFIMALFSSRHRLKKWEFRFVTAITINPDLTWTGIDYTPNMTPATDVPLHVRPYMNDYRFIIPMKGWIPLTKYEGFFTKLKRTMKYLLKSKKRGILIFSYDHLDKEQKMTPIDHIHSYSGEFDLISPELYEKECKSTLAANFTKSQDSGKIKLNWIIIAIIIIVALGIILKLTGAL